MRIEYRKVVEMNGDRKADIEISVEMTQADIASEDLALGVECNTTETLPSPLLEQRAAEALVVAVNGTVTNG